MCRHERRRHPRLLNLPAHGVILVPNARQVEQASAEPGLAHVRCRLEILELAQLQLLPRSRVLAILQPKVCWHNLRLSWRNVEALRLSTKLRCREGGQPSARLPLSTLAQRSVVIIIAIYERRRVRGIMIHPVASSRVSVSRMARPRDGRIMPVVPRAVCPPHW